MKVNRRIMLVVACVLMLAQFSGAMAQAPKGVRPWHGVPPGGAPGVAQGVPPHVSPLLGTDAFVGGGFNSIADGDYAVATGGHTNSASGLKSTVGGGKLNTATGHASTIAGGEKGKAASWYSTVSGGRFTERPTVTQR